MLSARSLLRRRGTDRSSRRPVLVLLALTALVAAVAFLARRGSSSVGDERRPDRVADTASPDELDDEDGLSDDELYEADQFLDAE